MLEGEGTMRIHAEFSGGNIIVEEIRGDEVRMRPDLRDTTTPWFYWCFCVEGAQGRKLTFRFPENCVGSFGAAVSSDLENWRWSGEADEDENGFTYTFGAQEERVYFCHDMRYSIERFEAFARKNPQLRRTVFARSLKGREVAAFVAGEGDEWMILTSRHHCCESTGTYVMEGAAAEYLKHPIPGVKLLLVPFMDTDGVADGDQGKNRAPHDHNRDYIQEIYPEIQALKAFAQSHRVRYFLDLHSPWHKGGRNDTVFLVTPGEGMIPRVKLLEECLKKTFSADEGAMTYDPANTMRWNEEWNVPTPKGLRTSGNFFGSLPGIFYASTLETAYFGTPEDPVSIEKLIANGSCVMKAFRLMNEKKCLF